MPSLRQLAQLAGVSAATVSRALRDDPRLRKETRERIQELAELYRYRPNRLTQSLVSGKSHSIGFLIPSVSSPYFSFILEGVLEQAFAESYHVIVLQSQSDFIHSCKALQTLIELQVDGMLISSGHNSAIPNSAIMEIWSHNIHAVRIGDTPVEAPMAQVTTDENQLVETALEYLCGLGHREIAYLGDPELPRAEAARRSMKRRGLSLAYHRSHHLYPSFADLVAEWRALSPPPTAVLAYSDPLAAELIRQASRAGIHIPRDLSVMGCANMLPLVEYLIPSLTTLEQHPKDIGRRAFDLLFSRMQSVDVPAEQPEEHLYVPTTLIKRSSCSAPRLKRRL
ncbi:MAG: LacI family DNA-binding transcriptional regulator [Armatimonadota bacterium]